MGADPAATDVKAELRASMRRMRRGLADRDLRSGRIWERVTALDEVRRARRVVAFSSIVGEPDTAPFIRWCVDQGKSTAVPEDDPDPTWPDVIVVPGVAFTEAGDRLGQGGGWYDRFLVRRRDDCPAIGVGFGEQVVAVLPLEAHDVRVDRVVTDG